MPRFSDLGKNNENLGSKYAIKRVTKVSDDSTTGSGDIFSSRFHISESLEASKQWFNKQKQNLCSQRKLYEDPFFPADNSALFFSQPPRQRIVWKRPKEIQSNAEFIAGGLSRFDVIQGELGDCWLLAAVSSLSMYPQLMNQVIPENQDFDQNYAGIFMFRLWQFGTWLDVVVDDLLPTYNNKLVYMHSKDMNEFWSALLEKAYAKISGSYEALKGGSSSEAMEDFTGGITELFDLGKATPSNLWEIMVKGSSRASLMGCSIEADPGQVEAKAEMGLIKGHAYSITDIKTVTARKGKFNLVRVRNPWGNDCEWTGAWSDKSPEWNEIPESERRRVGLSFENDGEFWMSYSDFTKYFNKLEICHLSPESDLENKAGKPKTKWEMCLENAEWQKNVTAGGCRNFIETFHLNPQFRVTVVDPDEDDEDNMGTLIVGIMQKGMRSRRKEGQDLFTIGYAIYQLKDGVYNTTLLDTRFFKVNASFTKSPAFINLREVCGRHKLPVGNYAIVPSTFNPNEEAKFMMRIFSEKEYQSNQLDQKTEFLTPKWNKEIPPEMKKEEDKNTERLQAAFKAIAGQDGEIDADELQQILNVSFKRENFKFDGFSKETCRSMVAMIDADLSGRLGFEEFKILWDDLRLWKTVFKKFDEDQSGNFNSYEIRKALDYIGFKVSNRVFTAIITRYASKEGIIPFDDYILLLVRLRTTFLTYKAQTKTSKGEAIFPQDEFMQCVLYL